MKKQCSDFEKNDLIEKLMGLGETSIQKSYYPQLRNKISELEEEKKKYQSFFNNAFNGILRVNSGGEILESNPAINYMTGYNNIDSGITGKSFPLNLMKSAKDWDHIIDQLSKQSAIKNIPIELINYEKQSIWISANIFRSSEDANILEIFCENISDKKRMEQELRQRQKMDALGQLSAGIAHDFNNILTGIMGSSELIINHVDKDYKKYVETILYSCERASELISKLLTFSRKTEIEHSNISIHSIIDNTISLLERSIDKKIVLSKDLEAESTIVKGDHSLLQNAFLNIALNAKDAMSNGGFLIFKTKNISLSKESIKFLPYELSPGNYIEIHIEDSGTGIPAHIIQKIFDPFFTTKKEGKGSGLGLSSVYGTIKKHNGVINVYSELGHGTSFTILLPVTDKNREEFKEDITIFKDITGTILLAEDEEMIRFTASEILKSMNFTITTAENGYQALNIYKKNPKKYDLVILDMIMPLMDGKETFHEIMKINPEAKVIISSGLFKPTEISELKNKNLAGFIKKPYQKSTLLNLISSILSEKNNYLFIYLLTSSLKHIKS